MGRIDNLTHQFWREHPECYAELFNVFFFKKRKVRIKKLTELDTKVTYAGRGHSAYRLRDNARGLLSMTDGKAVYAILAVEDSWYVDYGAAVHCAYRDALQLLAQAETAIREETGEG